MATPPPISEPDLRSIDDVFAAIAGDVPGFGGLFLDPSGDPSIEDVYLTDPTIDLTALRASIVRNMTGFSLVPDATIHPLQGRYDWGDLKRWYDIRYTLPVSPLLRTTDINEGKNRLEFGVANEADIAPVTQAFLDVGVPADAFEVHVAAPVLPA